MIAVDYSVLYMILAVVIAAGLAYIVSVARRKNIIKQEDLLFAIKALDLSLKTVSELRLDQEEEIVRLTEIIIDSLEYAVSFFDTEMDIICNAYAYSLELCDIARIELTETRKDLLMELITIVFNDKYIQFIEN